MKAIILSLFTVLFAFKVNADHGAVVANFSTNHSGAFVLSINGEVINRRPATDLNLTYLKPGRNNVYVEYHRGPRIHRSSHMIYLNPGHGANFNISTGRRGVIINKVAEYPLVVRGRGGRAHQIRRGYSFGDLMFDLNHTRFDNRKFDMAESFLRNRQVNTNQLNRILNQFSYERDKVDLVLIAYPGLRDPGNLPNVFHQFRFRSSIMEINRKTGRRFRNNSYGNGNYNGNGKGNGHGQHGHGHGKGW